MMPASEMKKQVWVGAVGGCAAILVPVAAAASPAQSRFYGHQANVAKSYFRSFATNNRCLCAQFWEVCADNQNRFWSDKHWKVGWAKQPNKREVSSSRSGWSDHHLDFAPTAVWEADRQPWSIRLGWSSLPGSSLTSFWSERAILELLSKSNQWPLNWRQHSAQVFPKSVPVTAQPWLH